MELMKNKMRADFDMVARDRRNSGHWTAEDVKEFNAAIKSALDSNDSTAIALWARWLADLATGVVFFSMVLVKAETGMRCLVAEERAKKAGAK